MNLARPAVVPAAADVICVGDSPVPDSPDRDAAALSITAGVNNESHSGRMDRKIRGLKDTYYGWFSSSGPVPIDIPCVNGTDVQENDVFIHRVHGKAEHQIWLMGLTDLWQPIQWGHIHPSLPSYRLIINADGEPRWVTRQTMITYASRAKAS